jgi:hypothetical protein
MRKAENLVGRKFERLTVLKRDFSKNRTSWFCICDCSNITTVVSYSLKSGKTSSCGCKQRESAVIVGKNKLTHGKGGTPEHRTWSNMLTRCRNKNSEDYKNYGGRGITVCDRWLNFENFLKDMGERPGLNYTIDRINNDCNYEPTNCKWETRQNQNRNKRNITIHNINEANHIRKEYATGKYTQKELAVKLGYTHYIIADIVSNRTWRE